jgi:hypothetical protein
MSWVLPMVVVGYQELGDVLLDQDRRLWDRLLIRRGLEALARAEDPVDRGPALCGGYPDHGIRLRGGLDGPRVAATVVVRHREPRVTR